MEKPTTQSWGATFTLFTITPLIAEYLLGSMSFAQMGALPVLCLLYGSGTVLIREAARTKNRGWPTIVILATAFAILEEGMATQSLFNPHYLHLSLLEYGYVPALGMGASWTVYVLSLHVIWSVCVPIAIVESLFPKRAECPWLNLPGRMIFGFLLLLGILAVTGYTRRTEHFVASAGQLSSCAVAVSVVIIWGLQVRSPPTLDEGLRKKAGPVWAVGLFAFLIGGAFEMVQTFQARQYPWKLMVATRVVLLALGVFWIHAWSKRAGWTSVHRFALGAGGLLVYCFWGYTVEISLHGTSGLLAHSILVALALLTVVCTALRMRSTGGRAAGKDQTGMALS